MPAVQIDGVGPIHGVSASVSWLLEASGLMTGIVGGEEPSEGSGVPGAAGSIEARIPIRPAPAQSHSTSPRTGR